MSQDDLHFHYVCTQEEARDLIERNTLFWISNCGCRENKGTCQRSRLDVCLQFRDDTPAWGGGKRVVSKSEVMEILLEARTKSLLARPFRGEQDRTRTDGICFCCDDCCEYFRNPEEKCDKGIYIEKTNLDACQNCGTCEDLCYFGARTIEGGELVLKPEACYGCGLCMAVCPEGCIEMVARN